MYQLPPAKAFSFINLGFLLVALRYLSHSLYFLLLPDMKICLTYPTGYFRLTRSSLVSQLLPSPVSSSIVLSVSLASSFYWRASFDFPSWAWSPLLFFLYPSTYPFDILGLAEDHRVFGGAVFITQVFLHHITAFGSIPISQLTFLIIKLDNTL